MTSLAAEGACSFAWRNYLLRHNDVSENDIRRWAVHYYVTDLFNAGEYGFDLLQIGAVVYLEHLDKLDDEQGARRAADEAVARCLEARGHPLGHP